MNISDKIGPQECPQHLLIWVWGGFAYRKLRPPMLLLSLKADAHLWTAEFNVWKCAIPIGVVGSRHACATLLSLVWGADSPPPKTEHCLLLLLTNSDACASSKLLSRVLWVQAGAGSQLSGIVGCECHVWGPDYMYGDRRRI